MLVRLTDHAASAIHNARLYEEMKRAHQFLELVAANSAAIIVRMDGRGRLTYASPGSETLLGVPLDQVVGRPASDFLHGGEAEARRFMRRVMSEGQVRDLQTVLVVARRPARGHSPLAGGGARRFRDGGGDRTSSPTSRKPSGSRTICSRRRRWKRWASSRAASPTTSTTC